MTVDHKSEVDFLYSLLDELRIKNGGYRYLKNCRASSGWPSRGVYFFFEDGEFIPNGNLRLVRVGTHALKPRSRSTLWGRLQQHKGSQSRESALMGGNHRGSVFRRHIGDALLRSGLNDSEAAKTWGVGQTAPREVRNSEIQLECAVTEVIGKMLFLWLGVKDLPGSESDRGLIEKGVLSIAGSSYARETMPLSDNWLGRYSARQIIRESGLWNVVHVDDSFDPLRFAAFERWLDMAD